MEFIIPNFDELQQRQQQATQLQDFFQNGVQSPPSNQDPNFFVNSDNLPEIHNAVPVDGTTSKTDEYFWGNILNNPLPTDKVPTSTTRIQQVFIENTADATIPPNIMTPNVSTNLNTTVQEFITEAVTTETPFISTSTNAAAVTQTPIVAIDTAANTTTEIISEILTTTTETAPNTVTSINDIMTTLSNKTIEVTTETSVKSERPLFDTATIKDFVTNRVTTEISNVNNTSIITTEVPPNVINDAVANSTQVLIDVVTESSQNVTQLPITTTTVVEVVQNATTISDINATSTEFANNGITTTISTVTKSILENTTGETDSFKKSEDNWTFFVVLAVVIALAIIILVGGIFCYKRYKKNKKFSAYQVSHMNDFSTSSCAN